MGELEVSSTGAPAVAALRAGAVIGGLAGVLRIVSAFIPYTAESPQLEVFYAVIDLGLLFGTFAVYLHVAGRVGWLGVLGFATTAAGLASIVGPDGYAFGVDMWRLGVVVISVGLAMLALSIHRNCPELRVPARLWGAYLVAFVWAGLGMMGSVGGVVSGMLFGGGYAVAGILLLTEDGTSERCS